MVVDGERGDLLDKLEEVDGAVEEGRFEFGFEVDLGAVFLRLKLVDVVGDVNQGDDVNGELAEDGWDDVPIPDVVLRSLFGELFDGLS